jgi:predicted PurR-regulated permease PerM
MLDRLFAKSVTKHEVSVSPSIVVFTVGFLLLLVVLFMIREILLLVFTSFILMVALSPLVKKLHTRLGLSRVLSAAITYFLFLVVVIGMISVLIPPLTKELYALIKTVNLPVLQDQIKAFNFDLLEISSLLERIGSSITVAFQLISRAFEGLLTIFTLIVLSFYLTLERPKIHKKIVWFTNKNEHFRQAEEFIHSLEVQLGGWVRGEIILMSLIGLMNYVGLTLLGVPYALPLALLAGLLEILPNIGPTIAAIPAVFLAYVTLGPLAALFVLLLSIVIQQIENSFLTPKIMSVNANVNPLVSILAILIGFKLTGVVGALLAIPLYIFFRAAYGSFIHKKLLAA